MAAPRRPERPPNLRRAAVDTVTCHTCVFMDAQSGLCLRYDWPVDRTDVCDTWTPDRTLTIFQANGDTS